MIFNTHVREALSARLERSFGSFLAHWPHDPDRFFGGAADEIMSDFEFRPRVTSVEEWSAQMDEERARQIEHGYDDKHDAEQGPEHLLNWAIEYARQGKTIAATTLTRNALRLLTDTTERKYRGEIFDPDTDQVDHGGWEDH